MKILMLSGVSRFIAVLASLVLYACAYTPQDANLNPTLQLAHSDIGKGIEVSIRVVDERTQKVLGHRGAAYFTGAKITTDQDIPGLFHSKIVEAFASQGFRPIAHQENHPLQLRVDIRRLDYYTTTGFWTGGIHTTSAIKVTALWRPAPALPAAADKYEKIYVSEIEKRIIFVPGAGGNEKQLNQAIAGVLEKLASDQALLSFLVAGAVKHR